MGESQAHLPENDTRPVIPDLSSFPLQELFSDDDSALGQAVRRVVDEMDKRSEQYAGHSSSS